MSSFRLRAAAVALVPVATLGLGGVADSAAATSAESYARPFDGVYQLLGHGSGNGVGLSRWSARSQALAGRSHREIEGFAFPRTTLATGDAGRIQVRLDGYSDAAAVDLEASPGLRLRYRSAAGKTVTLDPPATLGGRTPGAWRVVSGRGGLSVLAVSGTRTLPWVAAAWTDPTVPLRWSDTDAVVALRRGELRRGYRGPLLLSAGSGRLQVVDDVAVEDYLRSVVPAVMPASWPAAALQAQAVAARSYALWARASRPARSTYDIVDASSSLPYRGARAYTPTWTIAARFDATATDSAVRRTTGQRLSYGGAPVRAASHSSDGGWSAAFGKPYLVAQADRWDGASMANERGWWTRTVRVADLERAAPGIGRLRTVRVDARSGGGDWGGRVAALTLVGDKGEHTVRGDSAVRELLGTTSSYLAFRPPSLRGWVFPLPAGTWSWGTPYHRAGPWWSSGFHTGQDLPVRSGTPVYAASGGQVAVSGWDRYGYGNYVVVRHGDGVRTLYAHLSRRQVIASQTVVPGEQIGLSGSTGNSTGPHLHVELRFSDRHVTDPRPFLVGAPRATTVPLLTLGSKNWYVREVQQRLRIAVTATYDTATYRAVRSFQYGKGLTVTGTTTQATWRLLRASTTS